MFRQPSLNERVVFFPNSTLNSGRNRLLKAAVSSGMRHDSLLFFQRWAGGNERSVRLQASITTTL